jgi:hypothetical protein
MGTITCPANFLVVDEYPQACGPCTGVWTNSGQWTTRFLAPIVPEIVADQSTDKRCRQGADAFTLVCNASLPISVP